MVVLLLSKSPSRIHTVVIAFILKIWNYFRKFYIYTLDILHFDAYHSIGKIVQAKIRPSQQIVLKSPKAQVQQQQQQ